MKIVFTITTQSHGAGGHMYSLKEIATALSFHHTVMIINMGRNTSPVLMNSELTVINILSKNNNPISLAKESYKKLKEIKPDIIQSFDPPSYFNSRFFSILTKTPIILVKCGGVNPKNFYPFSLNHSFMSYENFDFFKNRRKFRNCKLALIPNRINVPLKIDKERIQNLKNKIGNKKIILRISRISEYYNRTFLQAIDLLNYIQERTEEDWCLVLVGQPENVEYLKKIKSYQNGSIFIISEKYFTNSAFELIPIANIMVGTGNSAMESGVSEKITFVPTSNSILPLKLTTENFSKALKCNFSERLLISKYEKKQNCLVINSLIKEDSFVMESDPSLKQKYFANFSLANGVLEYQRFYEELDSRNSVRNIIDFPLHIAVTLGSWCKKIVLNRVKH